MVEPLTLQVDIPEKFAELYNPARYKVYYGGRGGAKSWQFADALIFKSINAKMRVLCTREFQSSIADSVYRLLIDRIAFWKLDNRFHITLNRITTTSGAEFIFKGLHHNMNEIKSTEGIDIAWVEEAQSVSKESWDILIPTIRKEGSEIWASFNTGEADDPTYQRFVVNPPPEAVIKKVGWQDNPFFPEVLNKERLYLKRVDPDAYDNVWEGNCRTLTDACVLKGKYTVEAFKTPEFIQFYYGCDFGFAKDPITLIRCFVQDNKLFIDYEAWGVGVELDDIPELFDTVPGSRDWVIRADDSRPETINHIKKKGFKIQGAPKSWKRDDAKANAKGSVKEGIAWLRKFEVIVIHERCRHIAEEAKFWRYKTDKLTGEVLPILQDGNEHGWDAVRYGCFPLIKGGVNWENLL